MKRILRILLLAVVTGLVAITAGVQLLSSRVPELPPPDLSLPIGLADGGTLPLADVLDRARHGLPLVANPTEPPSGLPSSAPGDTDRGTDTTVAGAQTALSAALVRDSRDFWRDPLFRLAESHRNAGELDQALALYQSIGEDDPLYGLAQRRIGWDILTLGRHEPRAAVRHVQAALFAEPFDGNSWQDTARVYARTLGVSLD